jgi:hypothetical protein
MLNEKGHRHDHQLNPIPRIKCFNCKSVTLPCLQSHINIVDCQYTGLCNQCWIKHCIEKNWDSGLSYAANEVCDNKNISLEDRVLITFYNIFEILGIPNNIKYNHIEANISINEDYWKLKFTDDVKNKIDRFVSDKFFETKSENWNKLARDIQLEYNISCNNLEFCDKINNTFSNIPEIFDKKMSKIILNHKNNLKHYNTYMEVFKLLSKPFTDNKIKIIDMVKIIFNDNLKQVIFIDIFSVFESLWIDDNFIKHNENDSELKIKLMLI